MITGCYTLHLYCRHRWPDGSNYDARHYGDPAEYTGRTYAECKRSAMKQGWRFQRRAGTPGDDDVTCPICARYGAGTELPTDLELGGHLFESNASGLARFARAVEREAVRRAGAPVVGDDSGRGGPGDPCGSAPSTTSDPAGVSSATTAARRPRRRKSRG